MSSGSKNIQNPVYLARHVSVDGMATNGAYVSESFAASPYSCSSGYASPAPCSEYGYMYETPSYGASMDRARASSNASLIEQNWSQTSQSPTSSLSMPYPCSADEKSIIASAFPCNEVSYLSTSIHANAGVVTHCKQYEPHDLGQLNNEEILQLFPEEHYGRS